MTNASALPQPLDDVMGAHRWFRRTLLLTGVLKLVLAAVVPFTSDEAYFVLWGRHPDYGYYDHGAMTGWWLWVMLLFGDGGWLMRIPAVLTSQFVGWSLWRMLRPLDPAKAGWAATLYLVSPINVLNFLITTDTPLLFFSTLAVWCTFRGVQRGRWRDYFAAGLALGFAFLSKYFAVLLGVSFAVLLLATLGRPRVKPLLVLLAGIIPGVGINVAWNYHHSWVNVLFNLVTRQESSGFSLVPPLLFLVVLAALAGPGVLRGILRRPAAGRASARALWHTLRADGTMTFAVVFAVPLAVFLLVAFTHEIGAHWVLSFFPFLAGVLFAAGDAAWVRRMIRPTAIYAAVPAALALIGPLLPLEWASSHRSYVSLVIGARPQAVLAELEQYRPQYRLTTPSYAKSALLGFHARRNIPVFGFGSYHGRQDDLLTDFRTLAGQDLMVFSNRRRELEPFTAWFARADIREHVVHGAHCFVLLGDDFNYAAYREQVLQVIADRYYRMPAWLERFAAPSYFLERYNVRPRPPGVEAPAGG